MAGKNPFTSMGDKKKMPMGPKSKGFPKADDKMAMMKKKKAKKKC